MIAITNKVASFVSCQACSSEAKLYKIVVSNGNLATEIHLCKRCCLQLKSLLSCIHFDDVKMMSLDELDSSKVDKLN